MSSTESLSYIKRSVTIAIPDGNICSLYTQYLQLCHVMYVVLKVTRYKTWEKLHSEHVPHTV